MARQYVVCDDTLPFVNEWVRSKGTFFFTFSREQGRISKKWQTVRQTERQTDKVTTITLSALIIV